MSSQVENGDRRELQNDAPLLSAGPPNPSPATLTKLVKRIRALTMELLPVQVTVESLNNPTSRIITPQVISTYKDAAGDFLEALPYCLLSARSQFIWDANSNPADYDENRGRAIACEVLARRIVHQTPPDRITPAISTRLRHIDANGEESDMSSALEMAIDTHCTIFLSSSESQEVVNALWRGDLVQRYIAEHGIHYLPYNRSRVTGLWAQLDPTRLSAPGYQNAFRVIVWLVFLFVYSQAVREPLEKLDPGNRIVDGWEILLYVMALSFCLENLSKWYKLLRFVTWRAFGFWDIVSILTDSLFVASFILRVSDLGSNGDNASKLRYRSFQLLSFVAPLIWMKLITVFDGYKYIGMMQICVARMLQESGIFFALLSVLGIGFWQGLYALDVADGEADDDALMILNVMIQGLLQSPNYGKFEYSGAGLALYYFWNLSTAVILLNVLISLFSSAYAAVVDDAEAEYLAFFAAKTIGMIRAPDEYVYPAPFNIVEMFLVAPFQVFPKWSLSAKAYDKLNRIVMTLVFFLPLSAIGLYESSSSHGRSNKWLKAWFESADASDYDTPLVRDPEVDEDERQRGLEISRVPFAELVKALPNIQESTEVNILREIAQLKSLIENLSAKLEQSGGQIL